METVVVCVCFVFCDEEILRGDEQLLQHSFLCYPCEFEEWVLILFKKITNLHDTHFESALPLFHEYFKLGSRWSAPVSPPKLISPLFLFFCNSQSISCCFVKLCKLGCFFFPLISTRCEALGRESQFTQPFRSSNQNERTTRIWPPCCPFRQLSVEIPTNYAPAAAARTQQPIFAPFFLQAQLFFVVFSLPVVNKCEIMNCDSEFLFVGLFFF